MAAFHKDQTDPCSTLASTTTEIESKLPNQLPRSTPFQLLRTANFQLERIFFRQKPDQERARPKYGKGRQASGFIT